MDPDTNNNYSSGIFRAKFGNRKTAGLAVVLAILAAAIGVGILVKTRPAAETRITVPEKPKANYVLEALPTEGKNMGVKLAIDVGEQKVGFAKTVVKFDPKSIKVNKVEPGETLRLVIRSTNPDEANKTGNIELVLALGVDDRSNPPSGQVELGEFWLEKAGDSQVENLTIEVDTAASQVVDLGAREYELRAERLNLGED